MKIQKNGFTLPEIASVAVMVSIVTAIGYPMLNVLISKTEFAAAKLALSSLHRKCEAINVLGVSGVSGNVNLRGYKIKSSNGSNTKDISKLCQATAVVFISDKEARPSLFYGISKGNSGCLVGSKHLSSFPECSAKEQITLAQALNGAGSIMKKQGDEYYSFGSSDGGSGSSNTTSVSRDRCDENIDPDCR